MFEDWLWPRREDGLWPCREGGLWPCREGGLWPCREGGLWPCREGGLWPCREGGRPDGVRTFTARGSQRAGRTRAAISRLGSSARSALRTEWTHQVRDPVAPRARSSPRSRNVCRVPG
ncbi:hypothetical protein GCM10010532_058400 [Dactylosporangium siamense]